MPDLLSFILLSPDTYIYIVWVGMVFFTLTVVFVCRRRRKRRLCLLLSIALLASWSIFLWGSYVGVRQLDVVRVDLSFNDLPEAFDGYTIVHFSDVHAGTFSGSRHDILRRAVDSINAQHADAVVFTGDLQNKVPSEILEVKDELSRITARDGVFSVLGNHDYTMYSGLTDSFDVSCNQNNTEGYQTDMGWTLLKNNRQIIRRDSSHIVIAGMENDGKGRFPQLGDINKTLHGISRSDFVVMLEHDPTSWRHRILPHSHAQLTLSGHTHGGQFSLFGLTPAMLSFREYNGLYHMGQRYLYVTKGLAGVVPYRFRANPEIVVITLHSKP